MSIVTFEEKSSIKTSIGDTYTVDKKAVAQNLKRLTNQIYKLLPNREEGIDWRKPLDSIIIEVAGMNGLLPQASTPLFQLLCKLEGLKYLKDDEDNFQLFRRTVLDCLSIIGTVLKYVSD